MSLNIFRTAKLLSSCKPYMPVLYTPFAHRTFVFTARAAAATVDSAFISRITVAEKKITNSDEHAPGGPTARAQSHANQLLTYKIVSEITAGERLITGVDAPTAGGPTAIAQSVLVKDSEISSRSSGGNASGVLNSETMAKIAEKEKEITGHDQPVKRDPTAKAQQHVGEPITSEVLHDITEGEKQITGGERVKGGPTSKAQSELGRSKQ